MARATLNPITRHHLEIKAALSLRTQRLRRGTLHVNLPPCAGARGCDARLPEVLDEGVELKVIGPGGFSKVYVGVAAPRLGPAHGPGSAAVFRWSAADECPVNVASELVSLLDWLAREHEGPNAVVAELIRPGGDSMAIGLGWPKSVLNYLPAAGVTSRSAVAGAPAAGALPFKYMGYPSDVTSDHLIPVGDARDAMLHFLAVGDLSSRLTWADDPRD